MFFYTLSPFTLSSNVFFVMHMLCGSMSIMLVITVFSILPEKQDKLNKIAPSVSVKLKEHIEIRPASGSIQPGKEATVQVHLPISSFSLLLLTYHTIN